MKLRKSFVILVLVFVFLLGRYCTLKQLRILDETHVLSFGHVHEYEKEELENDERNLTW